MKLFFTAKARRDEDLKGGFFYSPSYRRRPLSKGLGSRFNILKPQRRNERHGLIFFPTWLLRVSAVYLFCIVSFITSPAAHAEISANHKAGAVVIGPAGDAECTSLTEGALRWDSSEKTHHMCDGTGWKRILASGGAGEPSTPPVDTGYFVLSSGTWNVNTMGAMDGANAKCLTDLTSNEWLNKDDAVSRNLLNATKVRAFLCQTGPQCNNPVAGSTYTFAASGNDTIGGASFTADLSSQGPGNTQNWSGTNYFGTAAEYWTGRTAGSPAYWGMSIQTACYLNAWGVTGGVTATYGMANNTGTGRWIAGNKNCLTDLHFICMVHP